MGLLYYNKEPRQQLIRNGSFENPFVIYGVGAPDWYAQTSDEDFAILTRQSEVVATSDWASKLELLPSTSTQRVSVSQNVTLGSVSVGDPYVLSALIRGNGYSQAAKLYVTMTATIDDDIVEIKRTQLFPPAEEDFNNIYETFRIKSYATLGAADLKLLVVYSVEGNVNDSGVYYIDNVKLELGRNPTRWSGRAGEPAPEQPTAFSTDPPEPSSFTEEQSQFDDGGPLLTSGGGGGSTGGGAGGGGGGAGGVVASKKKGGCTDEYDETAKKIIEQRITRMFKAMRNIDSPKWWSEIEDDEEFIKFVRNKLKKCFGEKKGSSNDAMWVQWANEKLASLRRAYETRVVGRMAMIFGNASAERFVKRKKLKLESNILHRSLEGGA